MTLFDSRTPLDKLKEILTKERDLILAGDFQKLEQLGIEKERLVGKISSNQLDSSELTTIREQIERNGLLLSAMHDGIGSAIAYIKGLRSKGESLATYDEFGRKTKLSKTPGKHVRRA